MPTVRLLIDAGIPEVARCARLGWEMPDKIQSIYSHVSADMERRVIDVLEDLWDAALAERVLIDPHSAVPPLDRLLAPYREQDEGEHPAS